jgi:hypothetical protein
VQDLEPRQQSHPHRLLHGEKVPEITAWLAITAAMVARITKGSSSAGGRAGRGVRRRLGMGVHQRALPEVVQRERREDEQEPGKPQRTAP